MSRGELILNKLNIFTLLVVSIYLSSCISITRIEPISPSVVIQKNEKYSENKVNVFLIGNKRCLTVDQRDFVKDAVNKYFPLDNAQNVNVYIHETNNETTAESIVNVVFTLGTFTVIPLYLTASYEFDIAIYDGGSVVKHYRKWDKEDALFSALVIPAIPWRHIYKSKRINMDRVIFEASKEVPIEISLEEEVKQPPTPLCSQFEELYNRQLW